MSEGPEAVREDATGRTPWVARIVGGIARHALTVLGGGLVADGWMTGEELSTGIGALLTLVGIGWSVWQKSRVRTEPGGEFNARAKVRKALPSQGGSRGGLSKGFVCGRLLGWVGVALLLAVVALGMIGCAAVTPYTKYEGTPTYDEAGVQDGIKDMQARPMTHAEAKEEGYSFLERNADQWWAWPVLLCEGLAEFSAGAAGR